MGRDHLGRMAVPDVDEGAIGQRDPCQSGGVGDQRQQLAIEIDVRRRLLAELERDAVLAAGRIVDVAIDLADAMLRVASQAYPGIVGEVIAGGAV